MGTKFQADTNPCAGAAAARGVRLPVGIGERIVETCRGRWNMAAIPDDGLFPFELVVRQPNARSAKCFQGAFQSAPPDQILNIGEIALSFPEHARVRMLRVIEDDSMQSIEEPAFTVFHLRPEYRFGILMGRVANEFRQTPSHAEVIGCFLEHVLSIIRDFLMTADLCCTMFGLLISALAVRLLGGGRDDALF